MNMMKQSDKKRCYHRTFFVLLFLCACLMLLRQPVETNAAATGFQTVNGKTYYIDSNGEKHKGFLSLNGNTYYFDEKTGVQLKGFMYDSSGKILRYFTKGKGIMVTGFLKNSSGKTRYFDTKTGLMQTGWMQDSSGYKYCFSSSSGYMFTGWKTNTRGYKRYFNLSNGRMLTGWKKSSSGQYRYFNTSTGYLSTGLKKIGNYYYYFNTKTGYRYQGGWLDIGSNRYYFSKNNGKAKTGWVNAGSRKYYFSSKGVLYRNKTAVISGVKYSFNEKGYATEVTEDYTYEQTGSNIRVYDKKYNRYYYLTNEYLSHPGVATGAVTDRDLLAAICESEAGDQGHVGMVAAALCVLNRTIDPNREFPSNVRHVIYQALNSGSAYGQYSVVSNGSLLKKLSGQYYNRTAAYQAADAALEIYNNYLLKGKPRTLTGFMVNGQQLEDFTYKYFMMESSFWNQPLNFNKVNYTIYRDHVFFVDWV